MARSARGGVGVGLALLFAAIPGSRDASAQALAGIDIAPAVATTRVGEAPDTFGASSVVLTLHWAAFTPFNAYAAAHMATDPSFRRTCPVASCYFEAPLVLPNGALIDSIEIEGCDGSAVANVAAAIVYYPLNNALNQIPPGGLLATSGTPGCTTFSSNLTPPLVVNNAAVTYQLEMSLNGAVENSLRSVRIRYRLQVSSAPAVATFPVDVPVGHPFYRWIEALASAGITSGCGPGSYCPDSPITRGQMAVFLAVALGLHFPN